MTSVPSESKEKESRGHFSELLKVEAKLALREPMGLADGTRCSNRPARRIRPHRNSNPRGRRRYGPHSPRPIRSNTHGHWYSSSLGIYSLPCTMVRYREMGWLRRVSVTPESPSRLLAAQLIINLVLAVAAILIVIFGSELIFGASLRRKYSLFCSLSRSLDCGDLLSWLGCCGPGSITADSFGLSGALMFLLFFLSGLWIQPAQVGGTLATIMYYSPSGAAVRALLYSVFNSAPSVYEHSDDGCLHGHLRIYCDPLLPLGIASSLAIPLARWIRTYTGAAPRRAISSF